MSERPHRLTDADMEQALSDLGRRLAYPPTPDLARSVRASLAAQADRPRPWFRLTPLRWGLGLACLALVLLLGTVAILPPGARAAVADRLGLRGIAITHVPTPVVPPATVDPAAGTPSLPASGSDLGLGRRLTLREAQERMAFPILVPHLPELESPDEVYLGEPPPGGQVALVYRARPGLPAVAGSEVGLLFTQFRGDVEPGLFGKMLGPDTRLESVTVNGGHGFWIAGPPHLFFYRDPDGHVQQERMRLTGNTLLWEQRGLTLRLESALGKTDALRIAASMR